MKAEDEKTGMSCQGIFFFSKGDEKPMTYFEQRADVIFVLKRSSSRDAGGWIEKG